MVSDPMFLSGAREMVAAVARRVGLTDAAAGQVALAVDEALCNVMRHGYGRRADGTIWLALTPVRDGEQAGTRAGIRIVIEDEARQVEPEQIRSRDLADVRPGGLGVHIIREVMDSAVYEKREGGVGMRLTMEKFVGGKSPCGCGPAGCGVTP
jgi:anti-sigma regulatory factor (Ser/Thr protein kinase)